MTMVMISIPDSLVEYVKLQVSWVREKKTGSLKLNYYQGGVTNMNRDESVKFTARPTASVPM
mgnify:FL=1